MKGYERVNLMDQYVRVCKWEECTHELLSPSVGLTPEQRATLEEIRVQLKARRVSISDTVRLDVSQS